jgi:hypothetical protein
MERLESRLSQQAEAIKAQAEDMRELKAMYVRPD